MGARVVPAGAVAQRLGVNTRHQDQMVPDLVFAGAEFLVAWTDRRTPRMQLHKTNVTPDGVVLDTAGTWLACQDTTEYQSLPALATNGVNVYVAWLGGTSGGAAVYGARLTVDGTPLDTVPLQFTPDSLFQLEVRVASNGTDYLVAWCGESPGFPGDDVFCRRVAGDGTPLDSAPMVLAHSDAGFLDPGVAFAGDRYLVTWTDIDRFDVHGCRVLEGGTVLDPGGFAICARAGIQRDAEVATDGQRFVVVWADDSEGDFDILAAFVDTAGTVGVTSRPGAPVVAGPRVGVCPNPARGPVSFSPAGRQGPGGLEILDVTGRVVRRLPEGVTRWDRADECGRAVPPGVYVVTADRGPGRSGTVFTVLR